MCFFKSCAYFVTELSVLPMLVSWESMDPEVQLGLGLGSGSSECELLTKGSCHRVLCCHTECDML